MTRTLLAAAAALTMFPLTAQASCWSNKAICQAICGADCCSNKAFSTPSDPKALNEIPVAALKAEMEGMRKTRANRSFFDVLTREIAARPATMTIQGTTAGGGASSTAGEGTMSTGN